ncbi:MAG: response regulator [Alphaproteobacteria bacterium]|nr:response regulator [Alphaproteobacteria bacterium]
MGPERMPIPAPDAALRVLLAEDNPVNQHVALAMLRRLGHQVDLVGNGREAVVALTRDTYDVVFMDLQMPEMDGLQATREIRKLSGPAAKTTIIAMTANAMQGDREACLAVGMDDYLAKPIVREDLVAALNRVTAKLGKSRVIAPLTGGDALFDEIKLRQLREWVGRDGFARLLDSMWREADNRVARMEDAVRDGDAAAFNQQVAHLNGAFVNLGFGGLAQAVQASRPAADGAPLPQAIIALRDKIATAVRLLGERGFA